MTFSHPPATFVFKEQQREEYETSESIFMQKNYGRFSMVKFVKSLSTFSETFEKGFGDIESVLNSEVSLIQRCPS